MHFQDWFCLSLGFCAFLMLWILNEGIKVMITEKLNWISRHALSMPSSFDLGARFHVITSLEFLDFFEV